MELFAIMRGENRQEKKMSEPLFIQSVMQDLVENQATMSLVMTFQVKNWRILGYLSSSKRSFGKPMVAGWTDLSVTLYVEQLMNKLGNRPEPVFPLLTKILDANDWLSVFKFTQTMPMD